LAGFEESRMNEHLTKPLEAWHDFYLVVGGGAAALTGLLFVIVSLGPHVVAGRGLQNVRAFISPVAAHFTYVLVVSAVMMVPEVPMPLLGAALALSGLGGIVFTAWTRVHSRWRSSSLPFLDWIWFAGMPYLTFTVLAAAGVCIAIDRALGPHGVAAAMVLFLVMGIRNAWDLVLWVAQQPRPEAADPRTGGLVEGPPSRGRQRKGR
jgi:hypothetical protein